MQNTRLTAPEHEAAHYLICEARAVCVFPSGCDVDARWPAVRQWGAEHRLYHRAAVLSSFLSFLVCLGPRARQHQVAAQVVAARVGVALVVLHDDGRWPAHRVLELQDVTADGLLVW